MLVNIEIFRWYLPSPPSECPQCPSLSAATTSSSRSSGWAAQLMPRRGSHCQRRRDPGEEFRPSSISARDSLIICWDHSNLFIPPWYTSPTACSYVSLCFNLLIRNYWEVIIVWINAWIPALSAKNSFSLITEQRVAKVCVWFAIFQPANYRTVGRGDFRRIFRIF